MKRATIMLGCYRRDDAENPQVYLRAIVAVLACYEPEVIAYVTDPRTGLPGKIKFLPTVAEVREACEEQAAWLSRMRARAQREEAALQAAADAKAAEAQRASRPTYGELCERLERQGLRIGKRVAGEAAEAVRAKYGITQDQWDAIPNAESAS